MNTKRVDEPMEDWWKKCEPIWSGRGDGKSIEHMFILFYGIWERTDTDLSFGEWYREMLHVDLSDERRLDSCMYPMN